MGSESLPPLPPGKNVRIKPDNKDNQSSLLDWVDAEKVSEVKAFDPTADLPDSDDENALSAAQTAPGSQSNSTPASRQTKKRVNAASAIRNFHSSLTEALRMDTEMKRNSLLGIYKTSALQDTEYIKECIANNPRVSSIAEANYCSSRVVHNSPVIKAPPFPKAEGRAIRDAKGSMPSRCLCPYQNCNFLDNKEHMEKFLHWCPAENMCDKRGNKEVYAMNESLCNCCCCCSYFVFCSWFASFVLMHVCINRTACDFCL